MKKFFSALVFSSFLVSTVSSMGTSAEKVLTVDINVNSVSDNSKKTENMVDDTTKTYSDKGNMFVHPGEKRYPTNVTQNSTFIYTGNSDTENVNSNKVKYVYVNNKPEKMKSSQDKEEKKTEQTISILLGKVWNGLKEFGNRFVKNGIRAAIGFIPLYVLSGNIRAKERIDKMAQIYGEEASIVFVVGNVLSLVSLFL